MFSSLYAAVASGEEVMSISAPHLYSIVRRKYKFERLVVETCPEQDIRLLLDEVKGTKPKQISRGKFKFGTLTIMWNSMYHERPGAVRMPLEDDLEFFDWASQEFHSGKHRPRNHPIAVPTAPGQPVRG